ncbi:MAG: hypothetical protein ACOY0S_03210 [Patescibacteria group bacterium]
MLLLLLLAELTVLYFLSRLLTQSFYKLFLLLLRRRSFAISLTTLLLFPGTVIHELAHLFTAEILGVPTGHLVLAPENIREENVKTGSVAIAKTDPFRRAAIGLAPVFVGLIVLSAISYWLPSVWQQTLRDGQSGALLTHWSFYTLLAMNYLLFAISNSMFSSPEDLKGFLPLAVTLSLVGLAAYLAGIRVGITPPILDFAYRLFAALTNSLRWVLAVNTILLLIIIFLIVATAKVTNQRITNK